MYVDQRRGWSCLLTALIPKLIVLGWPAQASEPANQTVRDSLLTLPYGKA